MSNLIQRADNLRYATYGDMTDAEIAEYHLHSVTSLPELVEYVEDRIEDHQVDIKSALEFAWEMGYASGMERGRAL